MSRCRRSALAAALVVALAAPAAATAQPARSERTAAGGLTTTLVCTALGTAGAKSAYTRIGEIVAGSRLRPAAAVAGILGLAASTCKEWLPRARNAVAKLFAKPPPPRDTSPPFVTAPGGAVSVGSTLDAHGRVLVRAFWAAWDPTGVASNEIASELDGTFGASTSVGTATSSDWWLVPGAHRFAVRARDTLGNTGAWTYGRAFTLSLTDAIALADWPLYNAPGAYGGTVAGTRVPGATRNYGFDGTGGAVVAPTGAGYGVLRFWIDGRQDRDLDLASLPPATSRVVYSVAGLPPGRHTIGVQPVSGFTAIDAFVAVAG